MKIESFNFQPGEKIGGKYTIIGLLGKGWEGEVYRIKEQTTGIERAAKFFYPHRNKRDKASKFYAKKLHKLRHCDIIIKYYGQDVLYIDGQPITYLISEFIEGELLSTFLKKQPGQRLQPFAALHLLNSLANGMESVHKQKEYHGDLHSDNIIVQRCGLGFELKIIDLYSWGKPTAEHIHDDVVDIIKIFYETLGGNKHYSKLPQPFKDIICGQKRTLILSKFKTAGKLRDYLKNMHW